MSQMGLEELLELMRSCAAHEDWWPAESPFEVMVGALLVQQTTWEKAYAVAKKMRYRGLMEPVAVANAEISGLEEVIRPCGCYKQKARRVKAMATFVIAEGGTLRLAEMGTEELFDELSRLEGVGRETADAMLAFAFLRPRFVAAAYTIRILDRTGVLPGADYDTAQKVMQELRGQDGAALRTDYAAFVEVAKAYCRTRPRCRGCPLRLRCPTSNG
jgi:endonuclease-3 related protein